MDDVEEVRAMVEQAAERPAPTGAGVRYGTTPLLFGGRFRFGLNRWTYVPFTVPEGVRRITVRAAWDRFSIVAGVVGNVLDMGIFGPAGWEVGNRRGFRGWSGGARSWFTISDTDATPGYLAGPIEPGTWAVALGPVVLNPLGMRWQIRIDLEYGDSAPEPAEVVSASRAAPDRGPGWYRGDLHLHSVHSDGQRSLDRLAAEARAAGLDFVVSTEHNTSAANRAWAARPPADLLVLAGQEVTTRHGHWLAVGLPPDGWVDWRYSPRDGVFADHAGLVRDLGGLVVAAHPAVPMPSVAWGFGYRDVDAVEVWNGHWNLDDELALRIWHRLLCRGRRIPAVGGSDSHAPHQPVGRPQTEVETGALTAAEIIEGVRHGRSYLTESSAVTLRLTAGAGAGVGVGVGVGVGHTLAVPPEAPVTVTATVGGAPGTTLSILTAGGRVARTSIGADGGGELRWTTTGAAARFARAEVRRSGDSRILAPMVALSNPLWLAAADGR